MEIEEAEVEEAAEEGDVALETEILVPEKCIKLNVLIVDKNAKFLSSPQKADRYIAETAIRTIKSSNY